MGALLDELRDTDIHRIDYVGFTFNGIHSSQLNILSVSDGSRYNTNLLPTIEDYSIDIVGGYGANYFGGTYKKKEISLNIAYDSVEEEHFRAMREWLSDREVHELYFDECPYKVYNAVVSKTPTFKYIAFGNVGTRVYKGEGTIVFTCYDPIGYSKNGNYLDDYDYENIDEWAVASNMLDNRKRKNPSTGKFEDYYDIPIGSSASYVIHAYNAGTISTPYNLQIDWTDKDLEIHNKTTGKYLKLKKDKGTYSRILIDTSRSVALQLFEQTDDNNNVVGYSEFSTDNTQVVLNQLVIDGRFFMLEPGLNELEITGGNNIDFQFYHKYI